MSVKLRPEILKGSDDIYISRNGKKIVVVNVATNMNSYKFTTKRRYFDNNTYNRMVVSKTMGQGHLAKR